MVGTRSEKRTWREENVCEITINWHGVGIKLKNQQFTSLANRLGILLFSDVLTIKIIESILNNRYLIYFSIISIFRAKKSPHDSRFSTGHKMARFGPIYKRSADLRSYRPPLADWCLKKFEKWIWKIQVVIDFQP